MNVYEISLQRNGWGDEALQFLQEPDLNFIILFNENAPEELADISILHTAGNLTQEPSPGDTLILGDKIFTITAVGDEAKKHFAPWVTAPLIFKGGEEPERPGCIMVEGDEALLAADIKAGMTIEIH